MAQLKYCYKCSTDKETTEFSKSSRAKDGLQTACKACNKIYNAKFRKERPDYQNSYYKTFTGKINKMKAVATWVGKGKPGVYFLKNVENGMLYIGSTSNLRKREFEWNTYLNNPEGFAQIFDPEFFADVIKYGKEAFEFNIIQKMNTGTTAQVRAKERETIKALDRMGIKLYNRNWVDSKKKKNKK